MPKTDSEIASLNPAHSWLLKYFSAPFEWFDCLNFTITSPISIMRVKEIIQTIVKRHSGLRTVFINEGAEWKQKINDACSQELLEPIIVSAKHLSKEQCDKLIENMKLSVCKNFKIDQLPLFQVIIIENNNNHYQFCVLFHHIIVDYISLVVFFKEFYHLYYNGAVKLSEPSSNLIYAKEIQELATSLTAETVKEYLAKEKLNELGMKNPLNIQRLYPSTELHGKHVKHVFSQESSEILLRFGRTHFKKNGLHAILAAPLYRALSRITSQTSIRVSHKLHGREIKPNDRRFFSSIGNFAINVPVNCDIFPAEHCSLLIDRLYASLNQDPTRNLIYDLISPTLPLGFYPDQLIAPVRFNFMGTISFLTPKFLEIDFHKFAQRVTVPSQTLTTYIEFLVYFCEKQLFIDMIADHSAFNDSFYHSLVNNYIEEINQVIMDIKKAVFLCQ